MRKTWIFAAALLVPAFASADRQADMDQLLENLKKEIPNVKAEDVSETPIAGLYQVINNGAIVYLTPNLKYAVSGNIIDLENRVDITARDQGQLSIGQINALGEDAMVVYPAKGGEEKRTITVFTDTSCPYCAKLHKEVPKLNEAGITVRYLLYPRAGAGSEPYQVMQSVWCSDDKLQALTDAKAGKEIPKKECENPIMSHIAMAQRVGLRGTPLIYLDSGERVNGYRPADQLIKSVKASKPLM